MANALRVGCVISLCSLRNTTSYLPLLSNATRFRSKFPFFTLSSSQNSFGSPSFRTLSSSSIDEAVTTEAITGNASGEAESSIRDSAGLLDIRVGRILRAWKHDEADSLYVEEVDIGEPEPRIICSGLVKYIPIEHLQVLMICGQFWCGFWFGIFNPWVLVFLCWKTLYKVSPISIFCGI